MADMDPVSVGARLRAGVGALVGDLTAGQRWTTGLAVGLALIVLAFGLPSTTRILVEEQALAAPAAPSSAPSADPGPRTPAPSSPPGPTLASPAPVGSPNATPTTPRPTPGASPVPEPGITTVVLAEPDFAVPGRGDDAIALHFVLDLGLNAAVELIDDVERLCRVGSRAHLAVAASALPAELERCLRDAGVAVVSWNDAGRADDGSGLSTRRGAARSLLDTATELDLDGRIALVADGRLRPALEAALGSAERAGLTFTTTVWLDDGTPGPGVALGLAGEDLDTVVFATSTSNQSLIASQLGLFAPGVDHVILDAADSVSDQNTSPALDGARAVTAVLFPWHPGNEALRASCRSSWEQAQSAPVVLGDAELQRVLLWCQQIALAAAIVDRLAAGESAVGTTSASTMTTALGPLAGGGFGPTRVTTATWAADCACWSSDGRFREAP